MPTKLNQVLAVRKGVQGEVHSAVTRIHHESQKAQLLAGFTKAYRRINEEDADLPGEQQRLQLRAGDVLDVVSKQYARLWDLTASIDTTNCEARGDVVVGGETLLAGAPVSLLLFLEKQLKDLHTIIEKLPVLDPAEAWRWDPNASAWATAPATTVRSKKVPRNHVLAEATERHQAQVQIWHEDVPVGYWDTIKFSGAIPGDRKNVLLARVSEVRDAVKVAREQANMAEVRNVQVAAPLFAHILAE